MPILRDDETIEKSVPTTRRPGDQGKDDFLPETGTPNDDLSEFDDVEDAVDEAEELDDGLLLDPDTLPEEDNYGDGDEDDDLDIPV